MQSADAHEILPGLWLGNQVAALNEKWLKTENITVVFNCTKNVAFSPSIHKQYRLPVDDNLQAQEIRNMTLWSHEAVYKLLSEYNSNHHVLVHCAQGIQRSATLMAMFLMCTKGISWQQAITYIQGIRPIAFRPSANFEESLKEFNRSYHQEIMPHLELHL